MRIGTKTLLYGNHQVILHPLFLLAAWLKLYKRINFKELICIIIHDWGYWGKPNLDGKEGEEHPEWAARWANRHLDAPQGYWGDSFYYQDLCLYHSRFMAKRNGKQPSKLCLADKLSVAIMPTWLWVFLGSLTGEIEEYINNPKYAIFNQARKSYSEWFRDYRTICKKWVRDGLTVP